MSRRTFVIAALVLGLIATAHADKAKAIQAYKSGMAEYVLDHYDAAIKFFEAGFKQEPQPAFLWNIAQAHAKAGRTDEAIKYYKKFLDFAPKDNADRGEAERRLAILEGRAVLGPLPDGGVAAEGDGGTTPPPQDTLALSGPPVGTVAGSEGTPDIPAGTPGHADNARPSTPALDLTAKATPTEPPRKRWPIWVGVGAAALAVVIASIVIGVYASSPSETLLPPKDVH